MGHDEASKILKTCRNPIIIGVMGMTGTGKSTFIKLLTKDPDITVGKGWQSCTKNVALTHMKFYDEGVGYDVFLADTPGFDDTDPNKDDTTVLRNIAEWLGLLHLGNKKLAGIIYLQTITADRITGSMSRNLEMLKGLVGADKMANVVMVTTRWEKVERYPEDKMEAERKHQELLMPSGFWYELTQAGASNMKHYNTEDTANRIIENIIEHDDPVFLQIQLDIADGKDLGDTEAGMAIKTRLEKQAEAANKKIEELRRDMESKERKSAAEIARMNQEYADAMDKQKALTAKQLRLLEVENSKMKENIEDMKRMC